MAHIVATCATLDKQASARGSEMPAGRTSSDHVKCQWLLRQASITENLQACPVTLSMVSQSPLPINYVFVQCVHSFCGRTQQQQSLCCVSEPRWCIIIMTSDEAQISDV